MFAAAELKRQTETKRRIVQPCSSAARFSAVSLNCFCESCWTLFFFFCDGSCAFVSWSRRPLLSALTPLFSALIRCFFCAHITLLWVTFLFLFPASAAPESDF
ncbi:hypothetical protein WMY93_031079 [Mugilogobius chulae]|uniref:Transmembrane protein n=1 Tax=Mugilogobius chulae TaxID=88201 RepID=A0AAW0ME35_9GOBI